MTQEIQKFWDKQAKIFDRADKKFESVYKDILEKTVSYLNSNDNVLDYGCATGSKTIELSKKVRHIHGIDISTEMIRQANKKKGELQISNISFSYGTIFNADLENNSFDAIIAFGIIHLLEDSQKIMQRIYELIKPGGLFISTTACMKDKMALKNKLEVRLYIFMKKLGVFPLHLNMFKSSDVEKLIGDQNFKIVETEKIAEGIPAIFVIARK